MITKMSYLERKSRVITPPQPLVLLRKQLWNYLILNVHKSFLRVTDLTVLLSPGRMKELKKERKLDFPI